MYKIFQIFTEMHDAHRFVINIKTDIFHIFGTFFFGIYEWDKTAKRNKNERTTFIHE